MSSSRTASAPTSNAVRPNFAFGTRHGALRLLGTCGHSLGLEVPNDQAVSNTVRRNPADPRASLRSFGPVELDTCEHCSSFAAREAGHAIFSEDAVTLTLAACRVKEMHEEMGDELRVVAWRASASDRRPIWVDSPCATGRKL
eukprot:981083-Prymnesium_polylepis.2